MKQRQVIDTIDVLATELFNRFMFSIFSEVTSWNERFSERVEEVLMNGKGYVFMFKAPYTYLRILGIITQNKKGYTGEYLLLGSSEVVEHEYMATERIDSLVRLLKCELSARIAPYFNIRWPSPSSCREVFFRELNEEWLSTLENGSKSDGMCGNPPQANPYQK